MKRILACLVAVATVWGSSVTAGSMNTIELKDGSVISGEVVSFTDGVYTIDTPSLGTVRIGEEKIRTIGVAADRPAGSGASSGPAGSIEVETVKALTFKALADGTIMKMILSLKDNPDFQKILNDPSIMDAVHSGDRGALMSNPQFMKLLTNPTVKEIGKRLGANTAD